MTELIVLYAEGPVTITAYALCLLAGVLLAVAVTVCLAQRMARRSAIPGAGGPASLPGQGGLSAASCLSMAMAAIAGAILGGRAFYCLTMLEFILVDLGGPGFLPQLWQGGYNLYGAVLGGMAGIALYARSVHRPLPTLMDLACPGAALVIAAGRLGEKFTSQGLGHYVETEALHFFPCAVPNIFGDWQLPVFAYEAFAAAVIFIVCLLMTGRTRPGRVTQVFVTLLGVSQVLLESLREDEFIRFGFVRFNMLAAAVTLGAVLGISLARQTRGRGWSAWQIVRTMLFVLGIALVILIEFALDKSPIDNRLLYAVMALALTVMGAAILREGGTPAA